MNLSHAFFKRTFFVAQLLMIAAIVFTASIAKAQISSVDQTFNAVVSKDTDNNGNLLSNNFTLQPDGKILVYGNFQIINGVVKNGIARLNSDGSLDNSFDCPTCDFSVGNLLLQPDGKIIIAGGLFSATSGTYAARIRRLNSDGSLDTSFYSPYNAGNTPYSISATVSAIQPDGKILVSIATFTGFSNGTSLYRLNADGSLDTSFTKIDFSYGRTSYESVYKVFVLPNGKILVATNSGGIIRSGTIRRFNSDGTVDATFESPTLTSVNTGIGGGYLVTDFEVLADGSIVIVGYFNSVNGISRTNIAKLLPAGNVDLNFAPPNVFQNSDGIIQSEIFSNGKILVRTFVASQIIATPPPPRFVLFNSDGSLNDSFTPPANLDQVDKFVIDGSDNVLLKGSFIENGVAVSKYARLNMNGSLINSFVVNLGVGGSVTNLAVQANGKVIIAGDFTQVNGVPRTKIARLNADGSLDSTFNPGTGFNGTVNKIFIQSDGKILVGGGFTIYNGTALKSLARLNTDGSLEITFNPDIAGPVYSIDLQSDNKIIIGGGFSSVNGVTRNGVARLNTDGGPDTSFNPIFGAGAIVRRVLVQTDGKIIVGGVFSGVNGFARTNLVRLNADGSLDATFNAGNIAGVTLVERQSDGKYLVVTGSSITRLNVTGTVDATFTSNNTNGTINVVLVQPDGSIIIGGAFTSVGAVARRNIARLKPNGTVDALFLPNGADNSILSIGRQADGKIIVGGSFSKIENVTRLGIARLIVVPIRAISTEYDYDGDGRADLAVFRPSNGVWYVLSSQNNSFSGVQFGSSGDKIAPADYDGDGKTDLAVFRENIAAASTGAFYILNSSDNSFRPVAFGSTGDIPVSGDWDGDGISDVAVYRDGSLTGGSSLFIYRPSSAPSVDFRVISWGAAGDKPVVGDYDGDGKLDAAIFRPSIAQWYILRSSNNQFFSVQFGNSTDILAPADYTGDGITDVGVFRPSNGTWYYSSSQTTPSTNFVGVQFGASGDLPVPADYDGDGKADVGVFRPSNGIWYLQRSTAGFTGIQFGANGDKPAENAYVR